MKVMTVALPLLFLAPLFPFTCPQQEDGCCWRDEATYIQRHCCLRWGCLVLHAKWEDGKENGKGFLSFPLQLSYISLLNQNKIFILLLVEALVDAGMYWLCSRDTCLRSSDYSDLHKINIRCVLGLISVTAFPRNPLGILPVVLG